MKVNIRQYTKSDFDFILNLFSISVKEERDRIASNGLEFSWTGDEKYIRWLVDRASDNGILMIAELEGEKAGFFEAEIREKPDSWDMTKKPLGFVMEIHVAKAFKRRGVATTMLEYIEEYFRSLGCERISLGVFTTNLEAIEFYDKVGYRAVYQFMGKTISEPKG